MKREKNCVFCNEIGVRLSKEHFWPEWLSAHLPQSKPNSHITELHSSEGKQPEHLERRSQRPGSVHTKKIRAVCVMCNSVWMSTLEARVKPTMLALMEGRANSLSGESIDCVARWVAVKTIVAEHATDNCALTPPEDRHGVKRGAVPPYFRIFVALHSSGSQTGYYRHSTTISLSRHGPDPALPRGISRNIQVTAFLVGPVFFYVAVARVAGFDATLLDPIHPMSRLWPNPPERIELGSSRPLGHEDLYRVSRSLQRLVLHPRVVYGGPLQRPTNAT